MSYTLMALDPFPEVNLCFVAREGVTPIFGKWHEEVIGKATLCLPVIFQEQGPEPPTPSQKCQLQVLFSGLIIRKSGSISQAQFTSCYAYDTSCVKLPSNYFYIILCSLMKKQC